MGTRESQGALEAKTVKAGFTFDGHPTEDTLEDYALEGLPDAEALEEHLLACSRCQNSLGQVDEYILLMKRATAELISRPRCLNWPRAKSSYAVIGAVTLAVVFLGTLMSKPRRSDPSDNPVQLAAFRGDHAAGMAHGRAGRPLDLAIDVSDLPEVNGFRLELVNSFGRRAWEGVAAPAADGRLSVHVAKELSRGVYWVRLYAKKGELLREFGLRAD